MGRSKSRPQVQYVTDPRQTELIAKMQGDISKLNADQQAKAVQLAALSSNLQAAETAAAKLKTEMEAIRKAESDPKLLAANEDRLFSKYLAEIGKLGLDQVSTLIALDKEINVAFLGKVSAGKSTAVNAFLQVLDSAQQARMGLGRTTSDVKKIGTRPTLSGLKINVVDFPGDDTDFNYTSTEILPYFATMDVLVVLYDNTVDYLNRLVRVAIVLKKPLIFLRTKIDSIEDDDPASQERTWQQEVARDRGELLKFGLPAASVFGISAKAALSNLKSVTAKTVTGTHKSTYQWDEFIKTLSATADAIVAARK